MIAQLHSVSKHYGDPLSPVLKEINFNISDNDTIAITGPSGSGKSTLLNILGTLDEPSSGKVYLDGNDTAFLDNIQKAGLRNNFIGFVFQQHHLLPQLTLLENVLLPAIPQKEKQNKDTMERALMLMEKVGLSDFLHQYPAKSSVGECQRTAVVRALINKPALLLADEPTGSLDNDNALKLAILLNDLNSEQQISMIVVTHSQGIASLMKHQYRLHSGSLELLK